MRRNLWTMNLTVCGIITAMFMWDPILPNILRERGATDGEVALIFALRSASFWCFQLLGGWLADRFGRVGCVVWPTFGTALLFGLASQFHDVFWFVTCLVSVNLMSSLQFPAFMAILAESSHDDARGRAFGWFEMLANAGVFVGTVFSSFLLEKGTHFNVLIAITAGIFGVVAIARWMYLVEPATSRTHFSLEGLRRYLTPNVWRVGIAMALIHFVWGMTFLGPFLAIDLEELRGMDHPTIVLLIGYGWLATVPACLAAGWLADRFGARIILAAGLFLHCGLLVAWFYAPSGWMLALFLLSFAAAEGSIIGSEVLVTEGVEATWRGMLLGGIGMLTGVFQAVAQLLGVWIRGVLGADAVYMLALAASVPTAMFAWDVTRASAAPVTEEREVEATASTIAEHAASD